MNVLFITYQFPPQGGPAVQRIAKLIKYLSRAGVECTVLTAGQTDATSDQDLWAEIKAEKGIEVIICKDIMRWVPGELRRLLKPWFIPDKMAFWSRSVVKQGIELVRQHNIQLIFSTSPPHSVQLAAARIAEETGLPWIADFRDEWSRNPTFFKSAAPARQKEMEQKVLSQADHILVVTRRARENFISLAGKDKISLIANGFDPEDFIDLIFATEQTKKLSIVYAGRLNELHSPLVFFKALQELNKMHNGALDQLLEVKIFGGEENSRWLSGFPDLNNIVFFEGYKPHRHVLQLMANTDALLLLATNMKETEFIPAKVYEYLRLGKTILAILSAPGELSRLLEDSGKGRIAMQVDTAQIVDHLSGMLAEKKKGLSAKAPNSGLIRQFDRSEQALLIKTLFDSVLQKEKQT